MERWRNIINIGLAITGVIAVAGLVMALWVNRFDPVLTDMVLRNFPVIIGLPFAFLGAFIVVALFRQAEGTIEFKALGIELKGAAGQVVLWLLCFLSITAAIAFLWQS